MKATRQQIVAWAERHDIKGTFTDIESAFEDAQTLVHVAEHDQPTQQPLTEKEIAVLIDLCEANVKSEFLLEFARAIEAAHGIGEKK